ncbi:MAG: hypothetical protein WDW36_004205 [Sanguina aurantia]
MQRTFSLDVGAPVVQSQARPDLAVSATPNSSQPHASAVVEPSENVLAIWRRVDCVCFDVDCTVTTSDSLDLLAEFMGCKEQVEALTNKAMDGSLNLHDSLGERLRIINCTPANIQDFLEANPPASRMAPNIKTVISALQARGIAVYLISGGFREMILPIAAYLGVPMDNVFANRMTWQWDDETGSPTHLVGFDTSEPTAHNMGKVQAINNIREKNPYKTMVMIGDGITDLEAVQSTGGADLFIGYGGVIERSSVVTEADWYIYDHMDLIDSFVRLKVAMIGSGAWACAAARMVAQNVLSEATVGKFDPSVKMWVFQEEVEGRDLTDLINEQHVNQKYLPGIHLGDNVVALPNLEDVTRDADILMICAPHQYIHHICKTLAGKVKKDAIAISLIKGMRVRPEGPQLISAMVQRLLRIDCSVLMGANIAKDIATEQMSEAVIGYTLRANGVLLQSLIARPYFRVTLLNDAVGAEMCGTLKNIVAIASGFVDGLGLGPNTKSAIIRQGLLEMRMLAKALYPSVRDETFFECCGVGDLIATCLGGRNRMVAAEWAKNVKAGTPKSFEELETEMLAGQKLQGVLTSNEVQAILKTKGWEAAYPLFTTVNRVVQGKLSPEWVLHYEEASKLPFPDPDGHVSDDDTLIPSRFPKAFPGRTRPALAPV